MIEKTTLILENGVEHEIRPFTPDQISLHEALEVARPGSRFRISLDGLTIYLTVDEVIRR